MEFGFLSILPPLLTIVLAIITKNVFISLFIGVFLGFCVIDGFHIISALNATLNGFITTFESHSNTIVIASILMIGALIYIIERSGGIEGFVEIMVRKKGVIRSKRAANIFTWLVGVLVFTSGSLSCLVVGSVTRPVNDAMRVSHEKSAFLVHATSTPVCVLLPLSGWGAAMIGYLTSGGVEESRAATLLVQSIPLNFYCIEIRADGAHISGYVNVTEKKSRPVITPHGKVVEEIEPRAFEQAISRAGNITVTVDHDNSHVYASTDEGTLKLYEDNIGLHADVLVTDDTLIDLAKKGKVKGWSFGMYNVRDELERRADDLPLRRIKALDLDHITLVVRKSPVYSATSVELRADAEVDLEIRSTEEAPRVTVDEPETPAYDNAPFRARLEAIKKH